jgi:hypothetical protein
VIRYDRRGHGKSAVPRGATRSAQRAADDDLRVELGIRRFGFAASKKFCWSWISIGAVPAAGHAAKEAAAIVAKLWLGTLAAVTVAGPSTNTTTVPSNIVRPGGVHTHRAECQ